MTTEPSPEEDAAASRAIEALQADVASRAAKDPEFHARLCKDPQESLEKEYQMEPGTLDGTKFRVIVSPGDTLTLVLPPRPESSGELSEQQLEAISGGIGLIIGGFGIAAVGLGLAGVFTGFGALTKSDSPPTHGGTRI